MRKAESPFLADWFAISWRWLALLALTAAAGFSGAVSWPIAVLLTAGVGWNIFMSLLAMQNRRLKGHRIFNMAFDVVLSALLFMNGSGAAGPWSWAGMMVIMTAAIYYEWYGATGAAVLLSIIELVWSYFITGDPFNPPTVLVVVGANLAASLLTGFLSVQLMKLLRKNYQRQVYRQQENEQRLKRTERDRMRALYGMVETLSATLNYKVVLDKALDLSLSTIDEGGQEKGKMVCAVLLFRDDQLQVEASRGFPPVDLKVRLPGETGALHTAIQSGSMQLVSHPTNDPELRQFIALQSLKSALVIPLIRSLNAFGVMLYSHPEGGFFTTERQELLEMIGHQAVIAILNAKLFQELEEENIRIVEKQDETRRQLARDLHDGPTQSVAAIAMRLEIVRRMLDMNPEQARVELMKLEDLARRTSKEIRHFLFTLRPLMMETEGLNAALQAMATKMKDTYQQNVVVEVDEEVVNQLEIGKQTMVFYLVEEAVNNARKHASAAQIRVRLKCVPKEPSIAFLEVQDNGVGFDVDAVNNNYERRGSLGMVNLRERTDLINGLLQIQSEPGQGTRVRVFIPLTDEAADLMHRNLAGG